MVFTPRWVSGSLMVGLVIAGIGCGQTGHDRFEVEGLVTLNAKPLPAGMTVVFTPEDGTTPVASGWTMPDGRYTMYCEPGKVGLHPGTYVVSVKKPLADEPGGYTGPPELAGIKIPPAFRPGSSTLRFTVPTDGHTCDIVMSGE